MDGYDFIEQHDDYTIGRKIYQSTDPRLGRRVNHDSRSLMFQVVAKDIADLTSIRHQVHIPVLRQGDLGSCTGNAGTGVLGSAAYWTVGSTVLSETDAAADESYAIGLYSEATRLDPYQGSYPPTDTGSDGLSIAKVVKMREMISGYTHATSLAAALTALAERPVLAGVEWREDMFNPAPDGRLSITGAVAGGHEIFLDELDVENKRIWMRNSWGPEWGIDGRAYFTWDDFEILLKARGDVTAFVPITQPAPTPTPEPTPEPEPAPEENPVKKILETIMAYLEDLYKKV